MHNVYVDYRTHNKVYVSDGVPDNGINFVKAFRACILRGSAESAAGQIISKCLFGVFSFSQKRTKTSRPKVLNISYATVVRDFESEAKTRCNFQFR